ncbi:hypothetical protein BTW00_05330 [Psychrobacter sp. C 20.9]|uniref:hypothetical protein n=1 Tax=Psychrobacter sp. C 20.9 TaxID=1926477 RepID=UPI0009469418|nr:hypothetical protein [Psychrobacter sp. C 20.9]OLF36510.1 hypothetical protein BTW00_05330 [Psychrobacter sp. C 20.9]
MQYFGFDRPSFGIKTFGFGSSEFSPLDLFAGGKQGVWYDPSDKSTLFQDVAGTVPVTKDGDPVALMRDKSGNGNHATQTLSAARPTYQTDGILYWLNFDGVDDELLISVTLKNNNSISASLRTDRPINSLMFGGSNGSAKMGVFRDSAFFRLVPNGDEVTIPYVAASKHIITGFRDNGYTAGRLNGVESKATAPNATAQTTWVTLGSANFTGQYFSGSIYGAILLDDYSVDKLLKIENYLSTKCGGIA